MSLAALDPADYALPDELVARLASPALVVHVDRVRENVRRVLALAGHDPNRWRPHVKTTKIPAIWRELARAGIRQFKCATVREAGHLLRALAEEGVEDGDVLLAYPLVGPSLGALGRVAAEHPRARVSTLCEEPARLADVPANVGVMVDVNPGMHRTGVPADDVETLRAIARGAGERFRGLHYYDGHLAGPDLAERERRAHTGYGRALELALELGVPCPELVTSGTPTFRHALAYAPFASLDATVHRVSPGTVVYHDLRSVEENPDLELLPAAVVFTRVVSHPTPGVVTLDAGNKAVASEAGDPIAFVIGHPGWTALPPSEEHLPVDLGGDAPPPRGSHVFLVPRHVCPTVNLAEEALLVEPGEEPRAVAVAARAHDLLV